MINYEKYVSCKLIFQRSWQFWIMTLPYKKFTSSLSPRQCHHQFTAIPPNFHDKDQPQKEVLPLNTLSYIGLSSLYQLSMLACTIYILTEMFHFAFHASHTFRIPGILPFLLFLDRFRFQGMLPLTKWTFRCLDLWIAQTMHHIQALWWVSYDYRRGCWCA